MNQEELKQRLIELLKECTFGINNHILTDYVLEETLKSVAEHLVKNGVTIRERGEWQPNYETFVDYAGIETEPIQTGWVCSVCGEHDNKYPFCPR